MIRTSLHSDKDLILWSSTTLADNSSYAWSVFFGTGQVSYGVKTLSYSVRAVRGGL